MKKIVALLLIASTTGCMEQEPLEMTADAQTELMQQIGDRVAGAPQACVSQRELRGNKSVGNAIVFQGATASTVYINRPADGCDGLNWNRALVTRTTSTQLCRGDIATVIDTATGTYHGSCALGDFTAYRRMR